MKVATDKQIEDACRTRSATDASRELAKWGLLATHRRCNAAISRLIADGTRNTLPNPIKGGYTDSFEITDFAATNGCKRLAERMIRTGHHFFSTGDEAKMHEAMRYAGMVS